MKTAVLSVLGYLLFATGMIALILSLVGLRISFLSWLDQNPLVGLIIKILLVMFGLILMYYVRLQNEDSKN